MPSSRTPSHPRAVDFGDKTWVDVQNKLTRWVRYRFPRVDADIIADALQDAVVDGMTYWQGLDSSHTGDPDKNFNFAVKRGELFLSEHISNLCKRRMGVDVLDEAFDRADDSPGPDVLVEEADLQSRARALLSDMDPAELEDFFDYFDGSSVRQTAGYLGISKSDVARQRTARRLDLQDRALKYGIL